MRNTLRLALCMLAYLVLMTITICSLAQPVEGSEYISNHRRTPAVQNLPPQVGQWHLTPTVIVCEHAPITQPQIRSAVQSWKNLGYRFFSTQYKHDPLNKCLDSQPVGYITIHRVTSEITTQNPTALAETHFFVNENSNEIAWAIIYVRHDIKPTVLEHEIGHALGFLHFNRAKHLMNEKWIRGGWDTDGLEKRRQ